MKRSVVAILGVLFTFAVHAQAPNLERMDVVLKSVPDGPVAKVQGINIGRAAFVQLYQEELGRTAQQRRSSEISDETRAQVAMLVLGMLVERALLYQEALNRELVVSEESVLQAWDAQQAQLRENLSAAGQPEATEEDILALLGFADSDQVLERIRHAMLTEKMRATVIREAEVSITDEEVSEAFISQKEMFSTPASLHLKQIYMNPKLDSSEGGTALKRAEDALEQIYAGQRFESVATARSEAPDRAEGGDMGRLPSDQLPPFMVEAAMNMEPGDVSEVIESSFGFHIITLVERQEGGQVPLEEVAPIIRRGLLAQRGAQLVRDHCDALIGAGAEVKVFLELDKNLALTRGPRAGAGE